MGKKNNNADFDDSRPDYALLNKRIMQIERVINEAVWISGNINEGSALYTESICKLTGYTNSEILSMQAKHLSLICSEDFADVNKEIANFYKTENQQKIILTYKITDKNNSLRWVKEEIRREDGNVFIGVLSDITQLKEIENTVKEYEQKLKDVNAAKDSFITILSHDLRAPFTSILGFAEILMNEPNLPIEDKTEYLTYIYEASQNQLQLINYLLDWSRLQTGKLTVEQQRMRAQSIVFNCVSSLTGNAVRKNIEIAISVDDNTYVNADERLITQALTNLLNNSIKFSPVNSKIEVTVNNFNKYQIEFVVRDSGVGISEEDQAKLFKVENMFSTEGTAGEKGSGLGLPLVKEIIEKHGGELWFYSQPGSGSEFHFTVPKPQNTVLLVDSNIDERENLRTFIENILPNYKLFVAGSGFEAMGMIQEINPSVVVTDHDLPLMNGLQLIESVNKGSSNVKIPFIVITKLDSAELQQEYCNYGVTAILPKPVDEFEFNKILQNIVY
jgi:PAS domain S-box